VPESLQQLAEGSVLISFNYWRKSGKRRQTVFGIGLPGFLHVERKGCDSD
jgi:hypothetical protein